MISARSKLFLALSLFGAHVSSVVAEDDLLRMIMEKNAAGKEAIHSYRAECLLTSQGPSLQGVVSGKLQSKNDLRSKSFEEGVDGHIYDITTVQLGVNGHSRFIRKTIQQSGDSPDSGPPRVRDIVGVTNEEYLAFSVYPNIIEQHFHSTSTPASAREKAMAAFVFNVDPVSMCFDTTSGPLDRMVEALKAPDWRIEVEAQPDENKAWIIRAFHPKHFGGERPEREYVFLADKGYALSQIRVYHPRGDSARISRDVEIRELSDGSWFPRSVQLSEGPLQTELTVISAEVNGTIEDSEFSLEALNMIRNGVVLIRYTQDKKLYFRYSEGNWVPIEPEELQEIVRRNAEKR